MGAIISLALITIAALYIAYAMNKRNRLFGRHSSNSSQLGANSANAAPDTPVMESLRNRTSQLHFDLSWVVTSSPVILSFAGLTESHLPEDYAQWPDDAKKKLDRLIASKDSRLTNHELLFTLTYLVHEQVFIGATAK